ncbi:hypothetical protein YSY43_39040 [Paenibacillus sp. YSY-4.3]
MAVIYFVLGLAAIIYGIKLFMKSKKDTDNGQSISSLIKPAMRKAHMKLLGILLVLYGLVSILNAIVNINIKSEGIVIEAYSGRSIAFFIGGALGIVFGISSILATRKPINIKKVNIEKINKQKNPDETVEDYLERVRKVFKTTGKRILILSIVLLCIGAYLDLNA